MAADSVPGQRGRRQRPVQRGDPGSRTRGRWPGRRPPRARSTGLIVGLRNATSRGWCQGRPTRDRLAVVQDHHRQRGAVLLRGMLCSARARPRATGCSAIYIGSDGKLNAKYYNGNVTTMTSAAPVDDGKWHLVTLTAGGNTQALYLDGAQIGSQSGAVQVVAGLANNYVGAGYNGVGVAGREVLRLLGRLPGVLQRRHQRRGVLGPAADRCPGPHAVPGRDHRGGAAGPS